jgi:NADH-quinone oxidoreductase subunit H
MSVVICAGSLNFSEIILAQEDVWFFFILFPAFLMFFISAIAETNRLPFDLPEAESELVSGYNTEYSAITFALFMLAEYSNMLIMSVLIVVFFFWWLLFWWDRARLFFIFKSYCFCFFLFVVTRHFATISL